MNVISSTFWGEGPSDERFLPKIIQRTLEAVLMECARGEWEVLEPCILKSRASDFPQQVVDIAKQSQGFTLVFVHTDADAPNETQKAIPNKITPALQAISQLADDEACKNIIAIIPVTKIENWKLADIDALQNVFGVQLDLVQLGLNLGTPQLEQRANSKELLTNVMKAAMDQRGRRRNQFSLEDIDDALSKRISLEKIARFDSFQCFFERLKENLMRQNIIQEDCDVVFV